MELHDDNDEKKHIGVEMPLTVYLDIDKIRLSGVTNMFDHRTVLAILRKSRRKMSYCWVRDNKEQYLQAIFKGIKIHFHPIEVKKYVDWLFTSEKEG